MLSNLHPLMSSLRMRLALLVVVAVVPALVFVMISFLRQRQETTQEAYGDALHLTKPIDVKALLRLLDEVTAA